MKLRQWISAAIRVALTAACIATGCWCADAQEIKVKSFSIQMEPMTVSMQRKDINGNICALVKVIIPSAQAAFEGNLIGNCDFRTSEYWCYLSPGSKYLKVKYPACEPLMIDFTTLLGSGLKSRTIYELRLDIPQTSYNNESFSLEGTINIKNIRETIFNRLVGEYPSNVKLFHNLDGDKYIQMLDSCDLKRNGNSFDFKISNIHIGDKLTAQTDDARYSPETITITKERLGRGDYVITLYQKTEPISGRLIDAATNTPLSNIEIHCNPSDEYNHNYVCHTDSNGFFRYETLLNNRSYNLYYKNLPSYYINKGGSILSGVSGIDTLYAERYIVTNYIKRGDFSISDISATSYSGDSVNIINQGNKIGITYPASDYNEVTILCKGHKTLKIIGTVDKAIKLKKGNESDVEEYFWGGKDSYKK